MATGVENWSSNCSFGHMRPLGPGGGAFSVGGLRIYMGQWTGMTKAFASALLLKWCCMCAWRRG